MIKTFTIIGVFVALIALAVAVLQYISSGEQSTILRKQLEVTEAIATLQASSREAQSEPTATFIAHEITKLEATRSALEGLVVKTSSQTTLGSVSTPFPQSASRAVPPTKTPPVLQFIPDTYARNYNAAFDCGPGCIIGWGISKVDFTIQLQDGSTSSITEAQNAFCATTGDGPCEQLPDTWTMIEGTVALDNNSTQNFSWSRSSVTAEQLSYPATDHAAFDCGPGCIIGWGISKVEFTIQLQDNSTNTITEVENAFCAATANGPCDPLPDTWARIDAIIKLANGSTQNASWINQ